MVPMERFELPTLRLQGECSTFELHGHIGHFLLEDALYRILVYIMVPLRLVLEVTVIDFNFL